MKPLLVMPRPLRVWSCRSPRGTRLWWYARCDLCNASVKPYAPLRARYRRDAFEDPGQAADEARTHLVQKHPTHPLVL